MLDWSRAQLHKLVNKEHAAFCLSTLRCLRDTTTPPADVPPPSSKQISVLRIQVTELSLLVLRQADINGCFIAASVCLPTAKAVDDARDDAHSRKTEADRVPGNVVRSIRCDESECRNDSTDVAETNLWITSVHRTQRYHVVVRHEPAMRSPPLAYDGLQDSCCTNTLQSALLNMFP